MDMALYSIADFIVDIQNKYNYLTKQCSDYKYNGNKPADFTVRVTDEKLNQERLITNTESSNGYLESVCAYRELCLSLPIFDAILIHASVISFEGKGIAFLARSGVGKTTHTMFWKRLYKDRVTIINGDKPIIRLYNGIPYAYGTPWAGKENLQSNQKVQLTDICFIERCCDNITISADKSNCAELLLQQVLHPSEPEGAIKTLEITNQLIKRCDLWTVKCNTSVEAAQITHDTIFGGRKNETQV